MSTLQLEKMGYNIGIRLVEDFLYRTQGERCKDFREVAEKVQLAFKLFLNVSPTVTGWSRWANKFIINIKSILSYNILALLSTSDEFSLVFDTNPVAEFVELPDNCYNLRYANILAGAVRGALEMVHIEVAVWFVQDTLKGDNVTEMRVKFVRKIEDSVPPGDD